MNKKQVILLVISLIVVILFLFIFLLINSREIIFEKEIKSPFSEQDTWKIIQDAFTDSSLVDQWPNNEKIISSGVRNLSEIAVTYKIFGIKKTYYYTLFDVRMGKGLKYQTKDDHPLLGVGEIVLTKGVNNQTNINWKGTFALQKVSIAGFVTKYLFIDNFFKQLQNNLNK